MKRFKAFFQNWHNTHIQMKKAIKQLSFKAAFGFGLETTGLAFVIILLPTVLLINLMMFIDYMKVWIVYGALIGYLFIYLQFMLQAYAIKDYSNGLEFDKIRQLSRIKTRLYGLLWFGFVYGLYWMFGGYLI